MAAARTPAGSDRVAISVVVPVRDGRRWIDAQLSALAGQDWDQPWEVVVADDGSTDGTPERVSRWASGRLPVRLVEASGARGPAAARNAGARQALGGFLAFCDADDVVQPGWLAAMADGLARADAVAGAFDFASLNGAPHVAPRLAATEQLGPLQAGLASNLGVRRAAFESVGGFSDEMTVGEDIDLCWRLQLAGFTFSLAPAAVVAKRQPEGAVRIFRRALAYGRSGPYLFSRYRASGMRREWARPAKSWAWIALSSPLVYRPEVRRRWAHATGVRLGRLVGSVERRVVFP